MTQRIFTRIPAGDPAVIEAIGKSSVADLHEAMETIPGRMSLLDPAIAPLNRGLKVVGQAVTAHVFPGDGLAAYRALQLAGAGQVLVVTTAGQASTPMFAELVSLAGSPPACHQLATGLSAGTSDHAWRGASLPVGF
jgi:4-hydroxy-4-methyl-2-oxoglutarate aldolase